MYKNVDKYENMLRYFFARLALFIWSPNYDKSKTVFCLTTPSFYYFIDMNEKIALTALFKNAYNWIET